MRVYASEQIGKDRFLTPEGFLYVRDCVLARTGEQTYHMDELPSSPEKEKLGNPVNGLVIAERIEDEVFRPETIASFVGKAICLDHPDGEDVNPENFRRLSRGVIIDPRRGTGLYVNCMVADLLVTDQDAIFSINHGKEELSCGYDCHWEIIGPGRVRQRNIVGNHVAIVDQGRCGPICAIGDTNMAVKVKIVPAKTSIKDKILAMFSAKDEAGLKTILDSMEEEPEPDNKTEMENPGAETHVHVHLGGQGEAASQIEDEPDPAAEEPVPAQMLMDILEQLAGNSVMGDAKMSDRAGMKVGDRMKDLCDRLMKRDAMPEGEAEEMQGEVPDGKGRDVLTARDSVLLVDSFQSTVALAEILMPGIAVPTFDQAKPPKHTFDAICKLRADTLTAVARTTDGKTLLDKVTAGRVTDFTRLGCGATRHIFSAAGALKSAMNRDGGGGGGGGGNTVTQPKSMAQMYAEHNKGR